MNEVPTLLLRNRNYAKNIRLLWVLIGGNQRKTFWIKKAKRPYFPLKHTSKLDGTAILLQGATALTIDQDSWERLAEAHSHDKTSTKVIFEPDRSAPRVVSIQPRKATRYFDYPGLEHGCIEDDTDVNVFPPGPFEKEPVFICVDIEGHCQYNIASEIGLSLFDVKDIH